MNAGIARVRMFAGPNGSGKSTIKAILRPELLGVHVNPDEIEVDLRAPGNRLDFRRYGLSVDEDQLIDFFRRSALLESAGMTGRVDDFRCLDQCLVVPASSVNSYLAAVVADFIRTRLLVVGASLSFETVMSSGDKIAFLHQARRAGYRTYLYYVATDDPLINLSRIAHRVRMGGHDVPRDKVIARYQRSLALLFDAIRATDRAYVFDNSEAAPRWLAEITNGETLATRSDRLPAWFLRSVWDRFHPSAGGPAANDPVQRSP